MTEPPDTLTVGLLRDAMRILQQTHAHFPCCGMWMREEYHYIDPGSGKCYIRIPITDDPETGRVLHEQMKKALDAGTEAS